MLVKMTYPGDYLVDRPFMHALCLLSHSFLFSLGMFFSGYNSVMVDVDVHVVGVMV